MAQSSIDPARLALLTNGVETYLKLDEAESKAFETLVASPEGAEVREKISVYEQRGIEKGIEQGIEQGIERGRCAVLIRLMQQKFGALPDTIVLRIEAITNAVELDRLTDSILTANSIEEMRIPGA